MTRKGGGKGCAKESAAPAGLGTQGCYPDKGRCPQPPAPLCTVPVPVVPVSPAPPSQALWKCVSSQIRVGAVG